MQGPFSRQNQSGAALIVALVLLLAITIIGLSNMQSSSLEMKMITSALDRGKALAAAEGALRRVEEELTDNIVLTNNDLVADFQDTCPNGLCFQGSYEADMTEYECEVVDSSTTADRVHFWRQSALWDSAATHGTVDVGTYEAKYLVEFLCFIDKDGTFTYENQWNGEPLFRISVLVEGDGGIAPVMLQSTFSFTL